MGWKIIEIEKDTYLSLYLENLVIEYEKTRITIPLGDIDTIISQSYNLTLTSRLICELSKYNINLIFCNSKHEPSCQLVSFAGNYNTLKIFNDQISWDKDYKNFLWKNIVKQKIKNQALFLKQVLHLDNEYEKLITLSDKILDFDVSNREGHAAKIYWHSVYGKNFNRNTDSVINWLLNYGYAVLRSMVCRSIVKKGLDPRVFLFHHSFDNTFALASDLMEIFRIVVDICVYEQQKNSTEINFYDTKQKLNKYLAEVKVIFNGKGSFLNNAIDDFMDSIINRSPFPELEVIWK